MRHTDLFEAHPPASFCPPAAALCEVTMFKRLWAGLWLACDLLCAIGILGSFALMLYHAGRLIYRMVAT